MKEKEGKARKGSIPFADQPIPDKIYFTIGEVAQLCGVKPHVIRYWETEFRPLSPVRRRGNRRYYQKRDIGLVRQIRDLLYTQGYTIDGARGQLLKIKKLATLNIKRRDILDRVSSELESILHVLEGV